MLLLLFCYESQWVFHFVMIPPLQMFIICLFRILPPNGPLRIPAAHNQYQYYCTQHTVQKIVWISALKPSQSRLDYIITCNGLCLAFFHQTLYMLQQWQAWFTIWRFWLFLGQCMRMHNIAYRQLYGTRYRYIFDIYRTLHSAVYICIVYCTAQVLLLTFS